MMPIIGKLALSGIIKWIPNIVSNKRVVFGIVVLCLSGYIGYLNYQNNKLEDQLYTQIKENGKLENDIATYNDKIQTQNNAIDQLRIQADNAERKLLASKNKADILSKKYDLELKALREQHVPKDCEASIQWLRDKAHEDLRW